MEDEECVCVWGGTPASSALGLQGGEAAYAVLGITGETGRSKQIVWSKSDPVSPSFGSPSDPLMVPLTNPCCIHKKNK